LEPHLYICLPVLNESDNLPGLISCLKKQSYSNFSIIVCVNQPNDWWDDVDKVHICRDNAKSMAFLSGIESPNIIVIDKSTRGQAWEGKQRGVGWARKLSMDAASQKGADTDMIITIDADTFYPPDYFQSVVDVFNSHPHILAHSNPYYHPLIGKDEEDMAILRYELYMRLYAINMLLIDNPYAFSAIGSGMACNIKQYKRLGGMTPKHSGEDFYFIQKMCKSGPISNYNAIKIYPQARFSDRVNFGTGPAMIKGDSGDWSSYPFYRKVLFQEVAETFEAFHVLFEKEVMTPMTDFLKKQLKREDIWGPLRKNFKQKHLFVNACVQLVDGLRILQYLKESHAKITEGEESDFMDSMSDVIDYFSEMPLGFTKEDIQEQPLSFRKMKLFRDALTQIEYKLRARKA